MSSASQTDRDEPELHDPSIEHAQADKAEFAKFYDDAAPQLMAFFLWLGASIPDASECAQEALTRCFQRWSLIQKHYAWCRKTAFHLYLKYGSSPEHPVDDVARLGRSRSSGPPPTSTPSRAVTSSCS